MINYSTMESIDTVKILPSNVSIFLIGIANKASSKDICKV